MRLPPGATESLAAERAAAWKWSPSVVFPIGALVVTALSSFTSPPTVTIVLLFAVALLPWALVAGGVRVPPFVVVAVTLGITAWLAIRLGDQAAMFLPVVAAAWTAAVGSRWPALMSVAGAVGIALAYGLVQDHLRPFGWVIWATGTFFGYFAGKLLHRQRVLTDQLGAARHDLALAAAENERKAIAREVHDVVGHSLTVVLLNIAGARRHLATNPAAADEALAQAETVGRESLDTVRTVVGLLHSPDAGQRDEPLPDGRGVVALVEQARRAGLPVTLTVEGDPTRLEPTIGLTVVRLLQESLANANRHAPGAPIDVELHIAGNAVDASVSNPIGRGTVPSNRSGVGLSSMTARVAALNGTLATGPCNGRWVVRWHLPRTAPIVAVADAGAT